MDSKFIVFNDNLLVQNISLLSGLTNLINEAETPLMTMTKRHMGLDRERNEFRKLLAIVLMNLPNMIANAI